MRHQFKIIQPDLLLHAAGDDAATYLHLLRTFLRIGPELIQEMQEAFSTKDAKRLSYHAHSLKNCIALLGAQEQSKMLATLESSARKNDTEFDFDFDSFNEIVQQLQKIVQEVQECLAEAEN